MCIDKSFKWHMFLNHTTFNLQYPDKESTSLFDMINKVFTGLTK